MTDEQVWDDLSRFALAMKRGATVVMNDDYHLHDGLRVDFQIIKDRGGIREIIEPQQKKVRHLNAEEWPDVAHCVASICLHGTWAVAAKYHANIAEAYYHERATCHPPGFPQDVRKLWVEE